MSRFITVQLEGVEYPLYFSMLALEEIYDKFGGMSEMVDTVEGETNPAKQYRLILEILKIENQAAASCSRFKGEECAEFNPEELLSITVPSQSDARGLWLKALACITAGQERTVETENDLKNAEAALEETL